MKTIFLLGTAALDLFAVALPQTKKLKGFAFLVHPRDVSDVYRKYPFFRMFSENISKKILRLFWPIVLSKITGVKNQTTGESISGWVISIPITADQMMHDRELAQRFIIRAAKLAQRKGAKIIGLGALTASLTRGGLDIQPHIDAGVTTGRLYTSKIITDTTEIAVEKLGMNKNDIQVAIVGAAGSIGTACAQILAKMGYKDILLVDLMSADNGAKELRERIINISEDIKVGISNEISSIKGSDIIIAVTNKPDALIKSEHLKPGAVVVDDAQPSDVDPKIVEDRKDVLILEGGVAHADGIDPHFNFGLKHKEDIFSCLAETIILSSTGHSGDFQVGRVLDLDFDTFNKLTANSEKLGFRVGDFQNFKKVYSDEDIEFVKDVRNS